jgi:hypothetical protein
MISPKSSCALEHSPIRIGNYLEGRGIRSCPIFPKLRPIQDEAFEIFGDCPGSLRGPALDFGGIDTLAVISEKSPTMGWKNANLRSEMTRLLRRAGVSGWPRLFHSMRASRQTELQREFPLHVVCSWLGNSPRIAQQSYLLVTEDDFAKAAGANTADNKHRFANTGSNEFYYDSNLTSSNPAPPLQNHPFSLEKRGFEDDSGDSPGAKAAHKTTQHLQAWTCMDRHRKPKQLADMRKTLGKPGFYSGEDRDRTSAGFPKVFEEFYR